MSYPPTYLEQIEARVIAAAHVLEGERYYEHVACLFILIEQCKHYQRLTDSMLNGVTGHRTFEDNDAETKRAQNEDDWYRYSDE